MIIGQEINMALSYKGISQAELAREIGTAPSSLNQEVKCNTLTEGEPENIANSLNASYWAEFIFPDEIII